MDIFLTLEHGDAVGQSAINNCPICNKPMEFLLPPGGAGPRTFRCLDCDRPDPLQSERVKRWVESELGRVKEP
ncbi:MAG: hypothetical protein JO283_06940 [Bradyrhizobium sp.]|jgi:hypothetical protein|nr:hypothetical protein [Bradyrhizobium sp.]